MGRLPHSRHIQSNGHITSSVAINGNHFALRLQSSAAIL